MEVFYSRPHTLALLSRWLESKSWSPGQYGSTWLLHRRQARRKRSTGDELLPKPRENELSVRPCVRGDPVCCRWQYEWAECRAGTYDAPGVHKNSGAVRSRGSRMEGRRAAPQASSSPPPSTSQRDRQVSCQVRLHVCRLPSQPSYAWPRRLRWVMTTEDTVLLYNQLSH